MAKPYIYVDITSLERSASEIGVFLNNYRKYFGGMDDTMNSLRTSWVSDDYTKFMQQWRIFYSGNSRAEKCKIPLARADQNPRRGADP